MKVNDWLVEAQLQLEATQTGTARLDALVLLEDVTGKDRTQLLAYPEQELSNNQLNVLNEWVGRRAMHEPLAYIRGHTEFYGRAFIVSPAVLEPRPESETIIDLLLKATGLPMSVRIADVGCGSGALGITAKLELPAASVDLLDIDPDCIKIAKMNVIKYTTDLTVTKSDLLEHSAQQYDVLLCNLPYVPDAHTVNTAALHEPKIAIFGGTDGLDVYRKLFNQTSNLQTMPLLILTESLPPQHRTLKQIALQTGYIQTQEDDFIQAFTRQS